VVGSEFMDSLVESVLVRHMFGDMVMQVCGVGAEILEGRIGYDAKI
jgi:hypothetical protein